VCGEMERCARSRRFELENGDGDGYAMHFIT